MIEFSEFECGLCGSFARETLPALTAEYLDTGKVQLVFWHAPLPIHEHAAAAAQAAECAAEDGKFWPMHDRLFKTPVRLEPEDLLAAGSDVGLRKELFAACMAEGGIGTARSQAAKARALGVTSTPTFFLGKRVDGDKVKVDEILRGVGPVERFREVLDKQVASPPPLRR